MREAKQVIVVRKDLGMRCGKMVAQGAHASFSAQRREDGSPAWRHWMQTGTTKVCVRVESEEELMRVFSSAERAGLHPCLVTDAGRTEFHGVPTVTCLAIGPAWSDEVDPITGALKLL
jgi:PTH2 family peptidyl-tRNA hydrolase